MPRSLSCKNSPVLLAAVLAASALSLRHASAAAITWTNSGGTGDGTTWDIATNQNWSNAGVPSVYNDGDAVTFNDTNNSNYAVSLGQSVAPASFLASNPANIYNFTIAPAMTLTVNGAFTVTAADPANGSSVNSRDTFLGGGNLIINAGASNVFIGGNSSGTATLTATLNISALANFTSTSTEFNLGGRQAGSTGNRGSGNVTLASVNTITATNVNVGAGSNSNGGGANFLHLGATSTTINADSFFIGTFKSTGTIDFASATGTLSIRNKAGTGRASFVIGSHQSSGTAAAKGALNLNGHSVDILASTILLGQITSATGAATVASSISFDTGTIDATSLTLGNKSGTAVGTATSTLTIGGGNLTVNSPSGPGAGTFVMGNNGSSGAGSADGILNVNGGTASIFTNITRGTATGNATINLAGGTLDLNGNNIGGVPAVTLNASTGTLKNVNLINGTGGITKSTAGTLTLAGTDNYTGPTALSGGSLFVDGSLTASPITASGTATLGGKGSIAGLVSIGSGDFLAPGDGPADINTLTVGSATLSGALSIDLNDADPNINDLLNTTGTLDISAGTSGVTFNVTGTLSAPAYIFANYGSLGGPAFSSVNNLPAGYTIDYDYQNNNDIALVSTGGSAPEPASLALLTLGGALLLRKRR